MFDCPCGKRHKKTSDIGRVHYRRYFPVEAAIEKDKPDPKVHEEVVAEMARDAGEPDEQFKARILEQVMDISGDAYGGRVPQDETAWKAEENQRLMTTYALDRYLLKSHKKRDLSHIIEYCLVTKNHEELKANWRASSWEDKATHAMLPFTLDEEDKYAFLVDARNKKKTGLIRKRRAIKALKEAVKPWEPTT